MRDKVKAGNYDKHIELTCKALGIMGIRITPKGLDRVLITFVKVRVREDQFSLEDMAKIEAKLEEKYEEKLPFEKDKNE